MARRTSHSEPSMPPVLSYNTNGFAHHHLADAIDIVAEIGYRAVAITLDVHALDPAAPGINEQIAAVRSRLADRNLNCSIETGGRFVLDARRKHWPTLVSAEPHDRRRRFDFLCAAIDIAAQLDADAVSFWSGRIDPGMPVDTAWKCLVEGCHALLEYARSRGVPLALEPEPGMFIETCELYSQLIERLATPAGDAGLGLALDVGHVHCLDDGDPADRVRQFADQLRVVHIEDMVRGIHEHLMFGEGEMDIPPIVAALRDVGYTGPLIVELSRHSHDAVIAARRAFVTLSPLLK